MQVYMHHEGSDDHSRRQPISLTACQTVPSSASVLIAKQKYIEKMWHIFHKGTCLCSEISTDSIMFFILVYFFSHINIGLYCK